MTDRAAMGKGRVEMIKGGRAEERWFYRSLEWPIEMTKGHGLGHPRNLIKYMLSALPASNEHVP